ncbi:hypothetical protein FA09DRAFT_165873 [Tilletiopsis washingtonensis]|jgi:hypothetical protein|uniref:Uncharacterized protein n=1 Tax=Tilletiopsis washingtonensis TaxID=58919 RepID=A0A316Z3H0_9BASI|nr:hypothetical protein FA09DRAFT_165873 [Tilletiopsis washingtonensis]PWN94733.1 hypothetical protein FA09DRAFT_165873 [Tilletiopsis washingtonensis]
MRVLLPPAALARRRKAHRKTPRAWGHDAPSTCAHVRLPPSSCFYAHGIDGPAKVSPQEEEQERGRAGVVALYLAVSSGRDWLCVCSERGRGAWEEELLRRAGGCRHGAARQAQHRGTSRAAGLRALSHVTPLTRPPLPPSSPHPSDGPARPRPSHPAGSLLCARAANARCGPRSALAPSPLVLADVAPAEMSSKTSRMPAAARPSPRRGGGPTALRL